MKGHSWLVDYLKIKIIRHYKILLGSQKSLDLLSFSHYFSKQKSHKRALPFIHSLIQLTYTLLVPDTIYLCIALLKHGWHWVIKYLKCLLWWFHIRMLYERRTYKCVHVQIRRLLPATNEFKLQKPSHAQALSKLSRDPSNCTHRVCFCKHKFCFCKMCKREDIFIFFFIKSFLNCISSRTHKAELYLCCKWPLTRANMWTGQKFFQLQRYQTKLYHFFSMPRSKVSKVLNSGKPKPFGIWGDWRILVD